jgi:hypothetical protein
MNRYRSSPFDHPGVFVVIHVKENFLDENTVSMDVSGVLDAGAVRILQEVCEEHLRRGMTVLMDLASVVSITRDGRGFIREIGNRVTMANVPQFMRLDDFP